MDKKTIAYNYIREEILSNRLRPNEPILELAIAECLKISRSPVREALRALESEGLVVNYPSRGSFVASLTPYDVEEIGELRILLECWALERSINRITEEELDELEHSFHEGFQKKDWDLLHQVDRKLHGLIVVKAGSKRVQEFIHILNSQIERVRRSSAQRVNRARKSYEEHLKIIACIRTRDLAITRDTLVEHLRSVSDDAVEMCKENIVFVGR